MPVALGARMDSRRDPSARGCAALAVGTAGAPPPEWAPATATLPELLLAAMARAGRTARVSDSWAKRGFDFLIVVLGAVTNTMVDAGAS